MFCATRCANCANSTRLEVWVFRSRLETCEDTVFSLITKVLAISAYVDPATRYPRISCSLAVRPGRAAGATVDCGPDASDTRAVWARASSSRLVDPACNSHASSYPRRKTRRLRLASVCCHPIGPQRPGAVRTSPARAVHPRRRARQRAARVHRIQRTAVLGRPRLRTTLSWPIAE